jgi:RHS repeat-associated protein
MVVKALEYLKPQPSSGPTSWINGPYGYDPAGNIKVIGVESYAYDMVGRLTNATLRGPDLSSIQTQSFTYDEYGNLTSTTKLGQTIPLTIVPGENKNLLSGVGYDAAGNVITAGLLHYDYDAVGMMNQVRVGSSNAPTVIYAYTAYDERLFAFDVSANTTHWTPRGLDNKVLRDLKQTGATWSVERDYVYRDGLLLAALKPSGVEHFSLDHLGTVRLVTNGSGQKIGYHVYWPFGEEWSPGNAQEDSPLKFTGHERDADPSGGNAALDYMHARYYRSGWGRFLSVDPTWSSADLRRPQSWNRYSYGLNNPVLNADPDGRCSPAVVDCAAEGFAVGNVPGAVVGIGVGIALATGLSTVDLVSLGNSDRGGSSGERFAENWIRQNNANHMAEKLNASQANSRSSASNDNSSATPQDPKNDKSREKAIKSLEQRIDEHKRKLEAYKANPDAFDNKGILKNAPNAEVRQGIIDGRIKHLEHEIQTFQNQVDALRNQ